MLLYPSACSGPFHIALCCVTETLGNKNARENLVACPLLVRKGFFTTIKRALIRAFLMRVSTSIICYVGKNVHFCLLIKAEL